MYQKMGKRRHVLEETILAGMKLEELEEQGDDNSAQLCFSREKSRGAPISACRRGGRCANLTFPEFDIHGFSPLFLSKLNLNACPGALQFSALAAASGSWWLNIGMCLVTWPLQQVFCS